MASFENGSSIDRDAIIERMIAARDGGLELEYDLPNDVPAQVRARTWQYPVRVFKPAQGTLQLLNRPDLEARVDTWLKTANLPRAACGTWYFTWNAFRVDCDPDNVVRAIERIQLTPDHPRDGGLYRDPQAVEPAHLTRTGGDAEDETFTVTLAVDPEIVRRQRADEDVLAGKLVRSPVTLDTAMRWHSGEHIAGTITVTLVADRAGHVHRRTKVTNLQITKQDGHLDQQRLSETVMRQRLRP